MTRKHYEMIAEILKAARSNKVPAQATLDATVDFIAVELADKMAQENPRFDKARFLKATGAK